jgi:hypothetical protein
MVVKVIRVMPSALSTLTSGSFRKARINVCGGRVAFSSNSCVFLRNSAGVCDRARGEAAFVRRGSESGSASDSCRGRFTPFLAVLDGMPVSTTLLLYCCRLLLQNPNFEEAF